MRARRPGDAWQTWSMSEVGSDRTAARAWPVVVGVVAISLAVRWLVLRDLLAADPLLKAPTLDDRAYLDMARAMNAGERGAWFLAPVYPWVVAAASRLFPFGMPLACGVDVALGAAASGALAAAGCALHSRTAGVIAGLAHALVAAFVFLDVTPGQETALVLLHALAFLAAIRLTDGGGWKTAALFGVCVGVAVLGRATSVAALLFAVPAFVRADARRRLRVGAACAAGLLVVLLPAALRNASVTGDFTPLPWSGGPNLYAANGPDARATISFFAKDLVADPDEMARRARSIAAAAEGRELTPGEASGWWARRAWRESGTAGELTIHLLRKAALFWSFEERGSAHSSLAESSFSPWLARWSVRAWWILAAGAAAWWVLRVRLPAADGAGLVVLGTWALLTVAFPLARYRLPVAAVALVLAAAAVVEAARGAVAPRRLLGAGVVGALAVGAAFLPIRERGEGAAYLNLAEAHLLAGDGHDAAKRMLQRVLDEEPGSGTAHEMLGRLLLDEGHPAEAIDHFTIAAGDRRTRWHAQVEALPALVATNRVERAESIARGLLSERRDDPELLANAAVVYAAAGDRAEAARLLAAARAQSAEHPAVLRAAAATGL